MEGFLKYIAGEWAVIFRARLTFIAAILVIAGLIWAVLDWRYGSMIGGMEERIKLRDDQINRLKEKVGTDSPDEIKAQIDRLEAQIKSLSPRHLSATQRSKLTDVLRDSRGHVEISFDGSSPDTRNFAGEIIVAFQNAGWEARMSLLMVPREPAASGVGVRVEDPSALTPRQSLVLDALRAGEIEFNLQRGIMPPLPDFPRLDAHIVITSKAP